MFGNKNVILNFLPLLYVLAMFCWWYICKRLVFNTSQPLPVLKYVIALSIAIWIIISGAVSLGTWDEWGWNNKDKDVVCNHMYVLTITHTNPFTASVRQHLSISKLFVGHILHWHIIL